MTRLMRDSVTPSDIPVAGTQLVMGYGTGTYTWPATGWARFPGVPHVRVDTRGTAPSTCDVLDVETGDVSAVAAPAWVKARRAATGAAAYPPVIYTTRSQLTALFNAMQAAGLHIVDDFRLIIATLDGTERVADMTGVTAVQHRGTISTGGHWDESLVYDDGWYPPPPTPVPAPVTMHGIVVQLPSGQVRGVSSADGGAHWA